MPPFPAMKPVTIDSYDSKANQMLKKTESTKSVDSKIDKSAKEFESLLLGSWLQQAQQSFATVPGGDEEANADPGKEQLQSFAMQSLSTALTASGGLGIAKSIAKLLHKTPDTSATPPSAPVSSR